MKKIKLLLLAIPLLLTSCNAEVGFGNLKFTKVHLYGTNQCYKIKTWHDSEVGIEVRTEDYGVWFISEGDYLLVENKCPICDKE